MKNLREVSQYDNQTGELLEGVLVYCGIKHNPYNGGWIMNSQDALNILAEDKDLTKNSLRVFLKMCAKLDFENWIQISQTDICNELDINKGNVSKAIKLLVFKGVLLQGPKVGRSFAYRLNPNYGWKGKVKNLNEYRKKVEEQETSKFRKP
ncbi:MAG: MarR family transcriptional regulator [Crocosphaera sp.]